MSCVGVGNHKGKINYSITLMKFNFMIHLFTFLGLDLCTAPRNGLRTS